MKGGWILRQRDSYPVEWSPSLVLRFGRRTTMAGLAILSLPSPSLPSTGTCFFSLRNRISSSSPLSASSSSSSPTSVAQDDAPPLPDSVGLPSDLSCKACGRDELERGCNGEGRIQGGIATVPGFGWWPIKAYRPCPGFVASGGRYRRTGQSMDEVAFGRPEKKKKKKRPSPAQPPPPPSSKEKQSPRR